MSKLRKYKKTTHKYLKCVSIYKTNKFVRMCYDAMIQIKDNKFLVGTKSERGIIYERNLLISLAYLLGKNSQNQDKCGYLYGGEVNKNVFDECFNNTQKSNNKDNPWIKYTKEKLNFCTTYVSPDFLIHKYKDFNGLKRGGQKLIVEAKSKKTVIRKEFDRDLFKLNVYLSRLKFSYSLYIIVNQTEKAIESKIRHYIDSGYYFDKNFSKRLLFLTLCNENSTPRIYRLKKEIYDKAKNNCYDFNHL